MYKKIIRNISNENNSSETATVQTKAKKSYIDSNYLSYQSKHASYKN